MLYAAWILSFLVYQMRGDFLNPHAMPLPDEEIPSRDQKVSKRGIIPKLVSDQTFLANDDDSRTNNLILYYSFDNQNYGASKVKDESGFDNNGMVEIGGLLLEIPGSTCGAAAFLWDQSIKTSFSTPDGVPKVGFTISMWLKMLLLDGERTILQIRGRRFGHMKIKFIEKNVYFTYQLCYNCSYLFSLGAETEISRNWFHLAATYNALTGIAQIYIDGLPLNRTWNKNFGAFQYWGNDMRLGGCKGCPSIRGFVDDIRMFNYALTSSEIQLLSISCCFINCKPGPKPTPKKSHLPSVLAEALPAKLDQHKKQKHKKDKIKKSHPQT